MSLVNTYLTGLRKLLPAEAPGGTVGQVIRFLHDPDSYKVIAQSFDDYLQHLIDDGYAFVHEEET